MTEKDDQIPGAEFKELKKANGDVFFEARRMPDNSFIIINWIGLQSLETVIMGCNQTLTMLRKRPCKALLNSDRELIGPWEIAINWLAQKWVPQAKVLGLRYYAHVLSPGIYGQRSYDAFQKLINGEFVVRAFDKEQEAELWLQTITF